jgi:hypothetical protein
VYTSAVLWLQVAFFPENPFYHMKSKNRSTRLGITRNDVKKRKGTTRLGITRNDIKAEKELAADIVQFRNLIKSRKHGIKPDRVYEYDLSKMNIISKTNNFRGHRPEHFGLRSLSFLKTPYTV